MTNYAFEGPVWAAPQNITYAWANQTTTSAAAGGDTFTGALPADYQALVQRAMAAWAAVANVRFTLVPGTAGANIDIGWMSFTGAGVLGTTDYASRNTGRQTFVAGTLIGLEDPSIRAVGSSDGSQYAGTSATLYQVITHELGHALGLAHSTDPAAMMYANAGPNNRNLSASDVAGVQALYGAQPNAPVATSTPTTPAANLPVAGQGERNAVYRFFDSVHGTQFLTADVGERDAIIATRHDLTFEGKAMTSVDPDPTDPDVAPVYRFFDGSNGTHFFTTSASERDAIVATRRDMVLEQANLYEHSTQRAGDVAVYRFFSTGDGSHFFTSSTTETASILQHRPDMVAEGVAFYSPA